LVIDHTSGNVKEVFTIIESGFPWSVYQRSKLQQKSNVFYMDLFRFFQRS